MSQAAATAATAAAGKPTHLRALVLTNKVKTPEDADRATDLIGDYMWRMRSLPDHMLEPSARYRKDEKFAELLLNTVECPFGMRCASSEFQRDPPDFLVLFPTMNKVETILQLGMLWPKIEISRLILSWKPGDEKIVDMKQLVDLRCRKHGGKGCGLIRCKPEGCRVKTRAEMTADWQLREQITNHLYETRRLLSKQQEGETNLLIKPGFKVDRLDGRQRR